MTGENLKRILKATGNSITELADKLGTSQQNLSAALNAKDVKTGLLEELSKVLDLPISYFFNEGNKINNATANGTSSIAAINSNVSMGDSSILQERVTMLEKLLEEKERTIKILMEGRK
ncbi:MAG: helix-turn-helix transcriptional regulator [Prevotella sp.]|nr:helix-turn-helix transcriptional regulator [Prevotella sp.]